MKADLHIHTTASDGTKTPAEAVKWAKEGGAEIISVTDHDTVAGLDEAYAASVAEGIQFVAGIELSAYSVCEIHILGYGFDWHNPAFGDFLQTVQGYRRNRNIEIGKKLAQYNVKPDIDFEGDGLGRMNIARAMVEEGYARDVSDAFERFLAPGGLAYCDVRRLKPLEAVGMLREFGALVSVAHPKKLMQDKNLLPLLRGLKLFGLGGLEVNYPSHTDADREELLGLCYRYGLLPTGGSDYHGDGDKKFLFDIDPRTYARLTGKRL